MSQDLTLWTEDSVMITDEELSATSHEEASKVFSEWQEEDDIMQVDEQIGNTLLSDDIFVDPCVSPSSPLEELVYLGNEDVDRFSLSLFNEAGDFVDHTSSLPFEERYKATLKKLAESMKRSQETRKSLQMKSPSTEEYARESSVVGVLDSIEKSTKELQTYLKTQRAAAA